MQRSSAPRIIAVLVGALLLTSCTAVNPDYNPALPESGTSDPTDAAGMDTSSAQDQTGAPLDLHLYDGVPGADIGAQDLRGGLDTAPRDLGGSRDLAPPLDLFQAVDQTAAPDLPPVLPANCLDVRTARPGAPDGAYTLYYNHDPAKPWTAYCRGLAGTPKEYLTLIVADADHNYAQYTTTTSGTSVRTTYTRIRIDPQTLLVDITDQTYAVSSGRLLHGSTVVTSMPYGAAMDCSASNVNIDMPSGRGNIDLRGTAFAVAAAAFKSGGFADAKNTATYSSGSQVVNLAGGGACGWISPGGVNPLNGTGALQLMYL